MDYKIEELGDRIRILRKAHKLTQEELAEKLGISYVYLCKIEQGKRSCNIDIIVKLCELFSVSSDYLLFGKPDEDDEFKKELLHFIDVLNITIKNL